MAHEGFQKWLAHILYHFVCLIHVYILLCTLVCVVVQNVLIEEVHYSFTVLKCMQMLPVYCVEQSSSLTTVPWHVSFCLEGG
jgi:hypothetical protein